ncbi:Plasmodium variant antigen protein Cir/Yir/Bir, putative [Plasmodium chabaudi adami]|uniref:Plasmodium variant antigen protein Cir/Yir/Bir, putative n=1 Tax=Plasmodium chabaudi adami TaxID=5826 RepID=A0A1C6X0P1_PLACE|nr:Plasmodium variant antigen protein Cir/Yir/Bir, putative [Plasmodium chabaudi adami]
MSDQLCELLIEVDALFTEGIVDEKKFSNSDSYKNYCPYENNQLRDCKNNYERINALGEYLYQKLPKNDKEFKDEGIRDNLHIEFFMMWLSDKMFKVNKDYKATLKESYEKNLKDITGKFEYWNALSSKEVYKDATIVRMSKFHSLLNSICKTINEYNKNPNNPNIENLKNHAIQCLKLYRNIHESVKECKPYMHLLDSLKTIYEYIKSYKITENDSLDDTIQVLLFGSIPSLTTSDYQNAYFIRYYETLSFNNQECGKVKLKDEEDGKKPPSADSQSIGLPKRSNTGSQKKTLQSAAVQRLLQAHKDRIRKAQKQSPSPLGKEKSPKKTLLPAPAQAGSVKPIPSKPAAAPSPQNSPPLQKSQTEGSSHKNGSEASKIGQNSLDSGKGIADGGKKKTGHAGTSPPGSQVSSQATGSGNQVTHPKPGSSSSGKGNTDPNKGGSGGGSVGTGSGQGGAAITKGDPGSVSGGTIGGAGSGADDQGTTGNQGVSGRQGGDAGGGANGDQGKSSGASGSPLSPLNAQGSSNDGTGSGTDTGARGAGGIIGDGKVDSNGGIGDKGGAGVGTGGTSSQGSIGSGTSGGPNVSDGQGATHPSGKSSGGWFNFLGVNLNPINHLPSVSDIYKTPKSILIGAANKISGTYSNTVAIVKGAYDSAVDNARNAYGSTMNFVKDTYSSTMKNIADTYNSTTSYIGNTINSVTNKFNPFSNSSQSDDNQPGSNGPGGGTDASKQSQPNPPILPPSSPVTPPSTPQPTQQSQPVTSPSPGTQTASSQQQLSSTHVSQDTVQNGGSNTVHQLDPNAGKGGAQTLSINKVALPSSGISPSNTGNGNNHSGADVKMNEKPSIWCIGPNMKCDLVGIGVIGVSISIFLAIMYKYLSFGSAKNLKKEKNMKRVIRATSGKKQIQIIINSSTKKKQTKKPIKPVYREKYPLLNIYKLMQADPMPFINLFFLLIFFVYKRKRDIIES